MYNQFEFNLIFWFEILISFEKNLKDKCYVFFKFLVIKDKQLSWQLYTMIQNLSNLFFFFFLINHNFKNDY